MTDIHSHIIPGLDDGSRDEYMTLRMLTIAAAQGTTAIVATPHCNCNEFGDTRMDVALLRKFRAVQRLSEDVESPVKVYLGMELLYSDDLPENLENGKFVTLNNAGYALTEFHFDVNSDELLAAAEKILKKNFIPLIAHPERYQCIQRNTGIAGKLKELGCGLQLNSGSFTGNFGPGSFNAAKALLTGGFADIIASDAHNDTFRTPGMESAADTVLGMCGKAAVKLLFEENPARALRGKELISLDAVNFNA